MGLELPSEYGYVMASIAGTAFLVQYMAIGVSKARKRYGVEYPKMYMEGDSTDAKIFNCTQRAHQNTLESAPIAMVSNGVLGLAHPLTAASLMTVYAVGRFIYFEGYKSGNPNKRFPGALISMLAYFSSGLTLIVGGIRRTGLF
ncbi:unnamed protein product [Ostreobium quekettii]|uniref:Glutathione S-transferase 3, mitochondrial n=1 Tax=Ostreobium quekettii TaxID=121088 RepID=A0A8S1J1Y9_9CHLO|nr:unnamed protein product [Ostreobium quekettii]